MRAKVQFLHGGDGQNATDAFMSGPTRRMVQQEYGRFGSISEYRGRQSNLLVVASKTVSRSEFKKMLIEEGKKRNLQYGVLRGYRRLGASAGCNKKHPC
jgi:hypothetical protein